MQLRPETQRALQLLLFLAHESTDPTAGIFVAQECAATAIDTEAKALEPIVTQLYHAGYVLQRSEESDDLCLARSPQDIRLGEIVRVFEGPIRLLAEPSSDTEWSPAPIRRLTEVMDWAGRELFSFLNQYTLDQFLPKPQPVLPARKRAPNRSHLRLVSF